ncbi:MAG: DNA alkylation repair protein [Gemmatimonadaceae bacterium]|nr:DNA alkylation repair protein [Gemmatimonadaceae bacterium]
MATPLKDQFGRAVIQRLSLEIAAACASFDRRAFERDAIRGFDALELLDRGRHLGGVLQRHLPERFGDAVDVLLRTLPVSRESAGGMSSFFYLPHTEFVRAHGLPHFADSMRALHALTQVFTGEFAMRPFLAEHTETTLAQLEHWVTDPSEHVRRLVSESTRPRLPWAPRLRAFQKDPTPVLRLLTRLRDDTSLYVRRSVANNLNDIGKDHPALLVATAAEWMIDASPERRWIIQHALRSSVKKGDAAALAVLGFAGASRLAVVESSFVPARPRMGTKVIATVTIRNPSRSVQRAVVDLRVHFVKANGVGIKVFKLASVEVAPRATIELRKTISLEDLTTRRHYPGEHNVDVQINGVATSIGSFTVLPSR